MIMRYSLLALYALTIPLSPTQAKSGDRRMSPVTLDCTIKGGAKDGSHMLIIIKPASQEVTISGMEGIGKPDITLINGQVVTGYLPPVSVDPDSSEIRSGKNPTRDNIDDQHKNDNYYNHDSLYDGRQPLKQAYVRISEPIIEFGTTTWLRAIPDDPLPERRMKMPGPETNFTIDRRTGVMLFHYAGVALNANCSLLKKEKLF
jgi:hypothetical protein